MNTEINLKAAELNLEFFNRIKDFLKSKKASNIKIIISDEDDYFTALDKSVSDIEQKTNLVTFTMEELLTFDPKSVK
jgi:hypothetical protein